MCEGAKAPTTATSERLGQPPAALHTWTRRTRSRPRVYHFTCSSAQGTPFWRGPRGRGSASQMWTCLQPGDAGA